MRTKEYPNVSLVGSFFRGKDVARVVEAMQPDMAGFVFEREPTNIHDPNAIKIIFDSIWVGYVERGAASWIARDLDAGWTVREIVVSEIGENAKGKPEPRLTVVLKLEGEEREVDRPVFTEYSDDPAFADEDVPF